jgi:hypothetical protein
VAERLAASQEGLISMESVSFEYIRIYVIHVLICVESLSYYYVHVNMPFTILHVYVINVTIILLYTIKSWPLSSRLCTADYTVTNQELT